MAKKRISKRTGKKTRPRTSSPKDPLFIGLSNPVELRKHILEPTREVIQFLQSYQEFKKTKEEKTRTILQLKEDLKNIRTSFNQLKKLLPQNKIRGEKTCQKIKKELKKERSRPALSKPEVQASLSPLSSPPTKESFNQLDSLERELGEIEKKLSTLS